MNSAIPVIKPFMPPMGEYINEIKTLWENRWITNNGEKVTRLEAELSQCLGLKNLLLFSNGHLALEGAIDALELSGEVITTPFTFVSTIHALVRKGLTPVFCDISEDDGNMNSEAIEPLITEKTSAILPVHVYGNPCDVTAIDAIAEKHGLKVLYDAAQAFGSKVGEKSVADFGDASIFSLHATKVFHTIEGGAVVFKDASLGKELKLIRNFGFTSTETVEKIGGNAKMNEFQAAMGLCNLKYIAENNKKRQAIFERYLEHLEGICGIKIIKPYKTAAQNLSYMPVIFDDYKYLRDEVAERLKAENIFTRKYFFPLVTDFECYRHCFDSDLTPVAKKMASSVLTLPMYSELPLEEVDRICAVILK